MTLDQPSHRSPTQRDLDPTLVPLRRAHHRHNRIRDPPCPRAVTQRVTYVHAGTATSARIAEGAKLATVLAGELELHRTFGEVNAVPDHRRH